MLGKRIITIIIAAAILFTLVVGPGSLVKGDELQQLTQPHAYSILRWEVANLFSKWIWKLRHWGGTGLSAEEKIEMVKDYFSLGQEIGSLEREVNHISVVSTEEKVNLEQLKRRLAAIKDERAKLEDAVEEIMEGQISRALAEQGLSVSLGLGWRTEFVFPPVDFEFGGTPHILAISPRHTIKLSKTFLLMPALNLDEIEDIEREVEELGLSALVEPLGGMATYPSIIVEGESLERVLSSVAHEWLHQYFFFRPLGRRYWSGDEMRTINETAASMGGAEIGSLILWRYYEEGKGEHREVGESTTEQAFDFGREMRQIRIAVDEYLRRGEISEAEDFMRERQKFLASKGYFIRKLNQAYFAFHGTYADSPASISPIGGELAMLRERSASVGEFVKTVAQISSYDDLKRLLGKGKDVNNSLLDLDPGSVSCYGQLGRFDTLDGR